MPLAVQELRYSTPEHLALERRFVDRVVGSREVGAGRAAEVMSSGRWRVRETLTGEQRRLVARLCLAGERVSVVSGKAGTGKTYALAAAREAWQAAGHPVLGVAIARRAAAELRDGAGIESTSVAALLQRLSRDGGRLPDACVLVVDEAGMAPTRQLSELLDHVERAGGKLVLAGDHRQLPELEAGGAFHGLVRRGLAIELADNVRQVHAWEREALDHLRDGRSEAALELYSDHGAVVVEPSGDATRGRLVDDWWSVRRPRCGSDDRAAAGRRRGPERTSPRAHARRGCAERAGGAAAGRGVRRRRPGGRQAQRRPTSA